MDEATSSKPTAAACHGMQGDSPLVELQQDGGGALQQRDAHVLHQVGVLLLQVLTHPVGQGASKLHSCK